MNYMAAEAEMEVRNCRWGEGLGGEDLEDRQFIDITEKSFESRLKDLTLQQMDDIEQMIRSCK